MLRVTGDGRYADRLERAFFNAAPGAVNRTFLGHVYFQAPNLAPGNAASHPGNGKFDEAYFHTPPCCTGNQARIVPEFVHHTWWGSADDGGLVLTSFAPTRVSATVTTTTVGGDGGFPPTAEGGGGAGAAAAATTTARVMLDVETAYPFSGGVNITLLTVAAAGTDTDTDTDTDTGTGTGTGTGAIDFPLRLRSPGWLAEGEHLTATLGGAPVQLVPAEQEGFLRLRLPAAGWRIGEVLALQLPMSVQAETRETFSNGWTAADADSSAGYCKNETAMEVLRAHRSRKHDHHNHRHHHHHEHDNDHLHGHHDDGHHGDATQDEAGDRGVLKAGHCLVTPGLPYCEVSRGPLLFALPLEQSADFGFALRCDASTMAVSRQAALPSPFDWPLAAPLALTAKAAPFNWTDAWALPAGPVDALPSRDVELVPYGCAKRLHISMFPLLK